VYSVPLAIETTIDIVTALHQFTNPLEVLFLASSDKSGLREIFGRTSEPIAPEQAQSQHHHGWQKDIPPQAPSSLWKQLA